MNKKLAIFFSLLIWLRRAIIIRCCQLMNDADCFWLVFVVVEIIPRVGFYLKKYSIDWLEGQKPVIVDIKRKQTFLRPKETPKKWDLKKEGKKGKEEEEERAKTERKKREKGENKREKEYEYKENYVQLTDVAYHRPLWKIVVTAFSKWYLIICQYSCHS